MKQNRIQVELSAIDRNLSRVLRQGQGQMRQFSAEANRINTALSAMGSRVAAAFAALGAGIGVKSVIGIADAYTLADGKLKLVTKSAEEQTAVERELYAQAQRTRTAYLSNVDTYTRFAQATKDLKISQADLLTVNETLNKAFIISGATEAERSATMVQLSQAFSSGVLRGEEFNSVAEQGGRVMQLLADYTGKSRGELRDMAKDGAITADILINSIVAGAQQVNTEFGKMPATVGQAGQVLSNTLKGIVADANEGSGATAGLSGSIIQLAATIEQNRELILSLFSGIAEAASSALEVVFQKINRLRGLGAALKGELSFSALSGMGQAQLREYFDAADSGVGKVSARLAEARKERDNLREGGSAERRQALTTEIRELEGVIAATKELQKQESVTSKTTGAPAARAVAPYTPGKAADKKGEAAAKKAASAAARELNAALKEEYQFRLAVADLSEQSGAKELLQLERERKDFVENWAMKAKTAEEQQERIDEITAWHAGARAKIERDAALKLADEQRAAAESGIALKEAQLAEQQADGTITATEALRQQVELLQERQLLLKEHLALMPKATAEEISAYNSQAVQLSQVNAKLATMGARLRLTSSFEGLKQGLKDVAESSVSAGETMRDAVVGAFASMDDAIAQFATGAKVSVGDLVKSIIADFMRLASQQYISAPLASGLGSVLGSVFGAVATGGGGGVTAFGNADMVSSWFHGGGLVGSEGGRGRAPLSVFANARRFHGGLMPDEFPAILQKGEGVFTKGQMAALGGSRKVSVSVHNYGRSNIEVEELGENEIRIIAREESRRAVSKYSPQVVASALNDPNSVVSKGMSRNISATRRR